MKNPPGFARRLTFGGILFAAMGLLAFALVLLPADYQLWLQGAGWVVVLVMTVALALALISRRPALDAIRSARGASVFAIVAMASLVGALGALAAGQAVLAVGGMIGATAALVLTVRALMGVGRPGDGQD